jgi:hypothetical protein
MEIDGIHLSEEQTAYIVERIERFHEECEERLNFIAPYLRKHQFLPVTYNFGEAFGILPDGSAGRLLYDVGHESEVQRIDSFLLAMGILTTAARQHPALKSMLPQRPQSATTCEFCKGDGYSPTYPNLICQCGGLGWVAGGRAP